MCVKPASLTYTSLIFFWISHRYGLLECTCLIRGNWHMDQLILVSILATLDVVLLL